jgi:hypothetical protein
VGAVTPEQIRPLADAVARGLDADVMFFSGVIDRAAWLTVAKLLEGKKHPRKNVLLTLITPGGDPDAAYRMARCLQHKYESRVFTFIPGWCKSAGTLVTLASKRLFISEMGELGPLDIQIAKADEIFEMSSGLSVQAALNTLQETAGKMFINLLLSIRGDTGRGITTRTAAELASTIVGTLLEPIYRQIEPIKIGENQRAMSITRNYGSRLVQKSGLLRNQRILDYLVSAYPDHGFVIDREEAGLLFNNVEIPTAEMETMAEALKDKIIQSADGPIGKSADIRFLSTEAKPQKLATRAAPSKGTTHEGNQTQPTVRNRRAGRGKPSGALGRGDGATARIPARNRHAANGANGAHKPRA